MKMKTTRQQDTILIALTKDYPRTIGGISADTGIPMPSVRRTIRELKALGYGIMTRSPELSYGYGYREYTLAQYGHGF